MSTSNISRIKNYRKLSQEELKRAKEKDHKLVKGIFRCYEPRGGSIKFSFRKYKGDAVANYTLKDGEIYSLPLMVAKHLNQNCWWPRHSHVLDANGNPSVEVGN